MERFWNNVLKTDNCWLWQGSVNNKGYGMFAVETGVSCSAHRFSYRLAHPYTSIGRNKKLCVMHSCDTRRCVNPNHLRVGTRKQNTADMVRKGRAPKKGGKAHGNAKLTWQIVRGIRAHYKGGWGAIRELRDRYGVSKEAIKDILAYRSWKEKGE